MRSIKSAKKLSKKAREIAEEGQTPKEKKRKSRKAHQEESSPAPKEETPGQPEPDSVDVPSTTSPENLPPELTRIWKEADTTCNFVIESFTKNSPPIYLCTHSEVCKRSFEWVIRCKGCPYNHPRPEGQKVPVQPRPEYKERANLSMLPDKEKVREMMRAQKEKEVSSRPHKEKGASARGITIKLICEGHKGKKLEDLIKEALEKEGIEGKKVQKLIRSASRAIKKRGLVIKEGKD